MSEAAATAAPYILPATVIGRADLSRLIREIEAIENELESQKAHSHDQKQAATPYRLPTMSRSLNDFLELNKLNLGDDQTRAAFKKHLSVAKDKAPSLHMTFAVDADPDFLQQLVTWVRREIHPQALITVGLQPSLIGGVYLRTPNHVHDYSVKTLLKDKRSILVEELEGIIRGR